MVVSPSSELIANCDSYMEMGTGYEEDNSAYMDMSPETPLGMGLQWHYDAEWNLSQQSLA